MPRTIGTFGDPGQDREIDYLHQRIDALVAQLAKVGTAQPAVQSAQGVAGNTISVQTDSDQPIFVSGLEFVAADGFSISEDQGLAKIDMTTGGAVPATSVTDVTASGAVGTSTHYAREDHSHKGVHTLAKSGATALSGDVTLSATAPITLTQAGNNVDVELANTAVVPGSYTNTNLTVDAQGRLIAASSGSSGGTSTIVGQEAPSAAPAKGLLNILCSPSGISPISGGLPALILPGGTPGTAYMYVITNNSGSSITVTPNNTGAGESIDGSASATVASPGKGVFVGIADPTSTGRWTRIV